MTTVNAVLPRINGAAVQMPESLFNRVYANRNIPGAIKKLMPYVLIDNPPEVADRIFEELAAAFQR